MFGRNTTEISVYDISPDEILAHFIDKNYAIIILYVPVFLLALGANCVIIAVVIRYHYMRNVTNYFLVNLSVADLLVALICMPSAAFTAYSQIWYLGEVACKAGNFLQCISVAVSVFTITAMALDRYMAITQPFGLVQCTCFDKKMAILTIIFIWITSGIIFAPILYVRKLRSFDLPIDIVFCLEDWEVLENIYPRKVFGTVCFTVMFAIPGFLILWAYAMMGRKLCSVRPPFDNDEGSISTQQSFRIVRERKRVAWILLLLAFVFAICWLPYNAVNLMRDAGIHINVYCVHYLLLLGHLNSAMNPIIYCIMSKNFRRSLKEMLCRRRTNFECRRNNRARIINPPIMFQHNPAHNTKETAVCTGSSKKKQITARSIQQNSN